MIVNYNFSPMLGGAKSKQFSPADIRNLYITRDPASGRLGWHDFPGLKKISTDTAPDRGQHVLNGGRYVVTGTNLQSEDEYGNRTTLGTIAGSERVIFADDGTNLLMVADNVLYHWNGATLSNITSNLPFGAPKWVSFSYDTFYVGRPNKWASSDTGDPTTWNSLNVADFDQNGDKLRRGYSFQGLEYRFGRVSTELWIYDGTGNPPLSRRGSTLQNVGIAGKWSVCNSDAFIYFLGDDRRVYQGSGSSARSVNTEAVSEILNQYNYVDDCIMSSFVLKGQVFVMLKFITAGDCLVYSESNDYWITLSAGTDRYQRSAWIGNSVQWCYEKNLVTDSTTGNTYELDFDTYTDNDATRLRILTGNPVTGGLIGVPQNQVLFSSLHVPMQVGVGLATGQGSDPKIICEVSPSGGEIFETQYLIPIGEMGAYQTKVIFHYFTTGYEIVPRIMLSDPVPWTVYEGGSVDIQDAGY